MKIVMIANIIIETVFTICVTMAAMYFNNAWILWWFVFMAFNSYRVKQTSTKEVVDNEQ